MILQQLLTYYKSSSHKFLKFFSGDRALIGLTNGPNHLLYLLFINLVAEYFHGIAHSICINMSFVSIVEQLICLKQFLLGFGFYFIEPSDQHRVHFTRSLTFYTFKLQHRQQQGMFREANSQANTKQLRKAKILDSFRQPAPARTKVMLTDLCPEEKAKIGDLVRTLESRKLQNQMLEQKIKEMEAVEKKYLAKIGELQNIIQNHKDDDKKLRQELALCKLKEKEKQRYIEHLLSEKQQRAKQRQRNVAVVDQFALTDPIISVSQAVQANPKKRKCKQRDVQTQPYHQLPGQSRTYPNNSRSFEKIMRGRTQSGASDSSKFRKSKIGRQQIMINDDDNEEQEWAQEKKIELEEEGDDDFNQLAKKWLELKEKNMEKIKQSYKKSKERQSNSQEKSTRKLQKSIGVPRQFNGQQQNQQQEENGQLQNNESFGPKKSRKGSEKEMEKNQDFDQIELNKILRSKNFSASRLLNKKKQASHQSEWSSPNDNKLLERVNARAPKIYQFQNTPNLKESVASNSRSRQNIDFYETDLLDIVSSIDRK